MKSLRIKIKTPKNQDDWWRVSFGKGNPLKRRTATAIFNAISRKVQVHSKRVKIAISVWEYIDTGWENVNETVASEDPIYLLYATACFLEDYLPKTTLKRMEKIWKSKTKN